MEGLRLYNTRGRVWEGRRGDESGHVRLGAAFPAPRRNNGESRRGGLQPLHEGQIRLVISRSPDRGQPSIQTSTWVRCGLSLFCFTGAAMIFLRLITTGGQSPFFPGVFLWD